MSPMEPFIQVEFNDGSYGAMSPEALDLCLRQKRLRRFRRSEGWIFVDIDPMRGTRVEQDYSGPERRRQPAERTSTRLS